MFDRLKIAAAKSALNKFLEGIGEVQELAIDKSAKTISAHVVLRGEALPLRIKILNYRLEAEGIVLTQFVCDREWLETSLNRFLAGKEIRLAENIRKAMNMIM